MARPPTSPRGGPQPRRRDTRFSSTDSFLLCRWDRSVIRIRLANGRQMPVPPFSIPNVRIADNLGRWRRANTRTVSLNAVATIGRPERSRRNGCGIFVPVISTQEAIDRAKQYATELLGEKEYTLEEVEQDVYKNRRVWRITVGFPKRRVSAPELIRSIAASLPLEY